MRHEFFMLGEGEPASLASSDCRADFFLSVVEGFMNWQIKEILYQVNDLSESGHLSCLMAGAFITAFFVFVILPGYHLATSLSLVFAWVNLRRSKELWDQYRWKV